MKEYRTVGFRSNINNSDTELGDIINTVSVDGWELKEIISELTHGVVAGVLILQKDRQ